MGDTRELCTPKKGPKTDKSVGTENQNFKKIQVETLNFFPSYFYAPNSLITKFARNRTPNFVVLTTEIVLHGTQRMNTLATLALVVW